MTVGIRLLVVLAVVIFMIACEKSPLGPTPLNGIKADFSVYSGNGLKVGFFDKSTAMGDFIIIRKWDFGDGAESTEINPTHIYAAEGDYVVSLTVTGQSGATDKKVMSGLYFSWLRTHWANFFEVDLLPLPGGGLRGKCGPVKVAGKLEADLKMSPGGSEVQVYLSPYPFFGCSPNTTVCPGAIGPTTIMGDGVISWDVISAGDWCVLARNRSTIGQLLNGVIYHTYPHND